MTDKQIIIDGVDVSGCPYYIDTEGGCSSHDCECIKCIHNECVYLRDRVGKLERAILRRNEQLDQLKQTNEELKKIIERLDVPKHEVIDMDIALENEKLKQTLANIKEIAEQSMGKGQMISGGWLYQRICECEVE